MQFITKILKLFFNNVFNNEGKVIHDVYGRVEGLELGMRIRIDSPNIEGYISHISGNNLIICNKKFLKSNAKNSIEAMEEISKQMKSIKTEGESECHSFSGITYPNQHIQILE